VPTGSVFVSYRRDDSAGYARALGDALTREFGAGRVFIDVDDISPGRAVDEVIQQQLSTAKLLLVLMGRRWLGERQDGPPRLFDTDDFVRREVASGLARDAVVMPVLLDGMAMPKAAQLPPDLHALAGRQALSLNNTRYADDLQRLMDAVRAVIGPPAASAPVPPRRAVLALAAGAAMLLAAAGTWWGLIKRVPTRVAVNGRWQAEVTYDWPNARFRETFDLQGVGPDLHGTASFLRLPRAIVEGRLEGDMLHFSTHTEEIGSVGRETVHRYRARLVGDELQGVMQTEGGSEHVPVAFVARRAPAKGGAASAAAAVPP
jgi:TIR domain